VQVTENPLLDGSHRQTVWQSTAQGNVGYSYDPGSRPTQMSVSGQANNVI